MKTILLSLTLCLVALFSEAQFDKGQWVVGGTVGLNYQHKNPSNPATAIAKNVTPQIWIGRFIQSNWFLGLKGGYALGNVGDYIFQDDRKFEISLFTRRYIAISPRLSMFVNGEIYYGNVENPTFITSMYGLRSNLGLNYFITKNIALDVAGGIFSLGIDFVSSPSLKRADYSLKISPSSFPFRVGLMYFPKITINTKEKPMSNSIPKGTRLIISGFDFQRTDISLSSTGNSVDASNISGYLFRGKFIEANRARGLVVGFSTNFNSASNLNQGKSIGFSIGWFGRNYRMFSEKLGIFLHKQTSIHYNWGNDGNGDFNTVGLVGQINPGGVLWLNQRFALELAIGGLYASVDHRSNQEALSTNPNQKATAKTFSSQLSFNWNPFSNMGVGLSYYLR
ncbi:MAG: hypothetical protein U0Y10_22195 [Spirosomataceae bacterium]